jgi:hypothetical protein
MAVGTTSSSIVYDRDLIKPNTLSSSSGYHSGDSDCPGSKMPTAPRPTLKAIVLLVVGGLILQRARKEMLYTGSLLQVEDFDLPTAVIFQQAQRRTRTRMDKALLSQSPTNTTDTNLKRKVSLDANTVKLMKETIHNLLEQVEEETGPDAKVSVGLMKDTIYQVMEHAETEAMTMPNSLETLPLKTTAPAPAKTGPASGIRSDGLKIAIYMTTHVSQAHLEYIQKCWPAALKRLELLHNVDLIVYTSSRQHDHIFHNMGFHHVAIYRYNETIDPQYKGVPVDKIPNDKNMQKQKGALTALVDPWLVDPAAPQSNWTLSNTSWFDDYDWVIRVNPDVLIRNDTWLLQQLRNPTIKGVFVKWDTNRLGLLLHTDFFAFRPTAIDYTALFHEYQRQTKMKKYMAEEHFTKGFRHYVRSRKSLRQLSFLPGVVKYKHGPGIGHVTGYNAPVTHVHGFVKHCPNYFDAHDYINRYY